MPNPPRRRRAPNAAVPLSAVAVALAMTHPTACAAQGTTPTKNPEPAPVIRADAGATYPAPAPPADPAALGRGIQRTMTLLATSAPQKRNKVRILFYGQSITEQDWSKQVAADLKRRFPHADLDIQNRAIGGFASQLLVRPLEHDVIPFYPDLVIFHVYGSHVEYENIIRQIRTRTAAEVLIQTDHANKWPDPTATEQNRKDGWWDEFMNTKFLPQTAQKYGCGLVDVRSPWVDYMKANALEPPALLNDGVHLNAHGNHLMARLVGRYLVHRPDLAATENGATLAKDHAVGKDAKWDKGRLTLPFDGNRVDLVAAAAAGKGAGGSCTVLIDGKAPSAVPATYAISRPAPDPWASPVSLSRVDHDAPLVEETWTLKVTESGPDPKRFAYAVSGSVTGPDGTGDSRTPFASKSGRAKIDPEAFFFGFSKEPVPVGHTITWRAYRLGADAYAPGGKGATTVVQGIPNGRHTLTLVAADPKKPPALRAVRVYRPPVAADAAAVAAK